MARWIRYQHAGREGFGRLEDTTIHIHEGDLFADPEPTGRSLRLDEVELLTPTKPSKIIALWNNFHALADKLNQPRPAHPLYLLKATTSCLAGGQPIRRPASYAGKIVYEGELGIVIGRRCREMDEAEAARCLFGYTCVNDVTAADLIGADSSFAQWTRAKSFDGFGVLGPVVATGLDPQDLVVRTLVNGQERQAYPVSDMILPPARLVSLLSHDMTLLPGDVICCGTSLGVGSLKEPGSTVAVVIEGIGTLENLFDPQAQAQAQAVQPAA